MNARLWCLISSCKTAKCAASETHLHELDTVTTGLQRFPDTLQRLAVLLQLLRQLVLGDLQLFYAMRHLACNRIRIGTNPCSWGLRKCL